MKERNARIKRTALGYSPTDHGCLSAFLHLEYGDDGGCQAFGGYELDGLTPEGGDRRAPDKACGAFISRVLDTLEIEDWEKLPGTPIRVKQNHCKVEAIGHFLKDQWYDPGAEFTAMDKQEGDASEIAGDSYDRVRACLDACVCIPTEVLKRVRIDNISTALVQIYEIASDPTIYEEEACKVISKQAHELLVNLERTGFKSHSNKMKGGDDEQETGA